MNILSKFTSAPLWLLIPVITLALIFITLSFLVLRTRLGENTDRKFISKIFVVTAIALVILPLISIKYLWIAGILYCIVALIFCAMFAWGSAYNNSKSQTMVTNLYLLIAICMVFLCGVSITLA